MFLNCGAEHSGCNFVVLYSAPESMIQALYGNIYWLLSVILWNAVTCAMMNVLCYRNLTSIVTVGSVLSLTGHRSAPNEV